MNQIKQYIMLMRLHRPIGIAFLWWPTAWALVVAFHKNPPARIVVIFLLGTIFMRSAGCIINDIADRHFDKHVTRTKFRPLANKTLSVKQALALFITLVMLSAILLLFLPISCFYISLIALISTMFYPYCKRFIDAPQIILALTFSLSIPMVFFAAVGHITTEAFLLMLINFLWILAYDTIYAMADKTDDLLINIKSTAILFGNFDKFMVVIISTLCHILWLSLQLNYGLWLLGWVFIIFIHTKIYQDNANYIKIFNLYSWYGGLMLFSLYF